MQTWKVCMKGKLYELPEVEVPIHPLRYLRLWHC